MDKLLEIKNVNLTYQSKTSETVAIDNLNIEINKYEFVSIVGPSGCGKTTILSMIAGLLSPTHGEIKVLGKKIEKPSTDIPADNLETDIEPTTEAEEVLPLPEVVASDTAVSASGSSPTDTKAETMNVSEMVTPPAEEMTEAAEMTGVPVTDAAASAKAYSMLYIVCKDGEAVVDEVLARAFAK